MRPEALRQTNAICRVFLLQRKLAACRGAIHKLPSDTISIIETTYNTKAGEEKLPADVENSIREHVCITSYLDADQCFSDWFHYYHNAKPKEPVPGLVMDFTERIAFEQQQKDYQRKLDQWQESVDYQTKITVGKIYNVLLFIDGGWLIDQYMDPVADAVRANQLQMLRQTCLPALCFILHKVLHTTRQHKRCLQIADYIASEKHQLYRLFKSDDLKKFLDHVRSSSVVLLDEKQDPLGYPLND